MKDTNTTVIRAATNDDIPAMVVYGDQFWTQTRYFAAGVEYDSETVLNQAFELIESGVVLMAEDQGRVVGLMLVIIAPFPMNMHYLQAIEWVFYVDPEYRRGGLGVKLIAEAEKRLIEKDVKFFTMVSLTNVTPKAANQLYESLGFEHSETNFTKDLSWQHSPL